jgi:hypothetical protein
MAQPAPQFWKTPIRYMRWASVQKPAYFYSIMIGLSGPVILVIAPPIRRYFDDGPRPRIPHTYPSTFAG